MPLPYHVAQRRGTRSSQEDAWCIAQPRGWFFGAVLDGHGGGATARYAATALPGRVAEKISALAPVDALRQSFEETSAAIEPRAEDGATALAVLLGQGQLHWANAGDCRLLLVSRDGCHQLTADHRLGNAAERIRIERTGRTVIRLPYLYVGPDGLMVTRSLGDRRFKPAGVTATPQTGQRLLDAADRWLIAATDGIWDALGNDEVAKITTWHKSASTVAQAIAAAAISNGGQDNATVLVVDLQQKPRGIRP